MALPNSGDGDQQSGGVWWLSSLTPRERLPLYASLKLTVRPPFGDHFLALLRGDGGGCSFGAATSCSRRSPSGATRRACRRCSPRSSARSRRTRRRRRTARRRRPSPRSARAASSTRLRRWASSSSRSSGGPRRSAPRCRARRRAAAGGDVPLLAADATVLTATAHAAARELPSPRWPRGAARRRPGSCVLTVWRR